MKSRYIISYDVCDARRLRLVYRKMCGYGDPLHYSVFRCDLSASDKIILIDELSGLIDHREDRIMIVDIGPAEGRGRECVEMLGCPARTPTERPLAVVV
jgi:CRISPR-associated protein Cas2